MIRGYHYFRKHPFVSVKTPKKCEDHGQRLLKEIGSLRLHLQLAPLARMFVTPEYSPHLGLGGKSREFENMTLSNGKEKPFKHTFVDNLKRLLIK